MLAEKRRRLDRAIAAIEDAARSFRSRRKPDWSLFKQIIKEIEMQKDMEWTKRYYSEEGQAKVEARKSLWSPELQERVSKQWAESLADIEASLGEDPAGPKAQSLAARWKKLVEGFTGGDPEIQKGLNKMYADQNGGAETELADSPRDKRFHYEGHEVRGKGSLAKGFPQFRRADPKARTGFGPQDLSTMQVRPIEKVNRYEVAYLGFQCGLAALCLDGAGATLEIPNVRGRPGLDQSHGPRPAPGP